MSLLFRSAPVEQRSVRIPGLARIYGDQAAGVFVDADTAMRHDAVFACRTRIAQDVAMMPVDVVRYQGGTRTMVEPTPQIVAAPSMTAKPLDWRYQVVDSWLGWGNAWGLVTQTSTGGLWPTRIELQHPSNVRVQAFGDRVQFFVGNVEHELWPVGDLWHEPAYTTPGSLLGMSPIERHAASIGMGLTAQKFGADFLGGGGHPSALIQPETDVGAEEAKSLKARFMDLTRGNREPIVLPSSVKYTPLQINPQESQFLETMRYSVEQVCRIYGEDPADYGSSGGGTSMTYANRSDADLARFKRRQFWVTKLQNALTDLLPRPVVVKLNTSATLMMTAKERHEIHALRLKSETATVNEVRKIEDDEPFTDPKFDEPGVPSLLGKPDMTPQEVPQ